MNSQTLHAVEWYLLVAGPSELDDIYHGVTRGMGVTKAETRAALKALNCETTKHGDWAKWRAQQPGDWCDRKSGPQYSGGRFTLYYLPEQWAKRKAAA